MLLSSTKFQGKAEEVLKEDLKQKPIYGSIEKGMGGYGSGQDIKLEDADAQQAGMMLYTSGTTNRPVRTPL